MPIIPARYYAKLYELLEEEGIDTSMLLNQIGISPAFLSHPESLLRTGQVEQLVDQALQASQRPDLGLEFGKHVKLSSHSILGYAMLSSPTVGYALRLCSRFFNLILPLFSLNYSETSDYASLSYKPTMPMSRSCLLFHVETIVATVHWEMRALLDGPLPSYSVFLSTERPANARHYKQLIGATHHFAWNDTLGFKAVFPSSVAAKPLNYADSAALKMAEARCVDMQRRIIKEGSMAEWVKMMLLESNDAMLGLGDIAGLLHVSERTLDRYLLKENVRFNGLKKAVMYDKSIRLLKDELLSITQVAHALGYTDASNFTRAFRQIAGITPVEFRNQRRSG